MRKMLLEYIFRVEVTKELLHLICLKLGKKLPSSLLYIKMLLLIWKTKKVEIVKEARRRATAHFSPVRITSEGDILIDWTE